MQEKKIFLVKHLQGFQQSKNFPEKEKFLVFKERQWTIFKDSSEGGEGSNPLMAFNAMKNIFGERNSLTQTHVLPKNFNQIFLHCI